MTYESPFLAMFGKDVGGSQEGGHRVDRTFPLLPGLMLTLGDTVTRTIRLALATFVFGFLAESAAELYQLVSYGFDRPGWIGFYYVGLVTTGLGFYLMYRGRHEWTDLHRRNVYRGHRFLWAAVGIFGGALVAIAVLGTWEGRSPSGGGPWVAVAWVVGGLVALAFGNFFLGLATLVDRLTGRFGRPLLWAAFAWSLGVAVLTGIVVGEEFRSLLHQFFTDPLGLVVSFAPLAFVIAPLFVSYLLFAAAYTEAYLRLRSSARPPASEGHATTGRTHDPEGSDEVTEVAQPRAVRPARSASPEQRPWGPARHDRGVSVEGGGRSAPFAAPPTTMARTSGCGSRFNAKWESRNERGECGSRTSDDSKTPAHRGSRQRSFVRGNP